MKRGLPILTRVVRATLIPQHIVRRRHLGQKYFAAAAAAAESSPNVCPANWNTSLSPPSDLLKNAHQRNKLRRIDLFVFNSSGAYSRTSMALTDLLQACNLQPRDVLTLEGRKRVAIIQPLSEAIVLSISHVRAVIQKDQLFVFNPGSPVVLQFVHGLSEFLQELDEKTPAFEATVLECILLSVSQKYSRRIKYFQPVITKALQDMRQQDDSNRQLNALLPLRTSLDEFERSSENIVKCLKRVLLSDHDMTLVNMTQRDENKAQLGDNAKLGVNFTLRDEVGLVLESYICHFEDLHNESATLRKTIEVTQATLELSLDEYRNRLININMRATLATVGLAFSTTTAGFFGMNLQSGLEEGATALFWGVVGCASLAGVGIYAMMVRQAKIVTTLPPLTQFDDIPLLASSPGADADLQEILLSYLDANGGKQCSVTEEQFRDIVQEATGQHVDVYEIDQIFQKFDHNSDGKLDYSDCVQFLCTQQVAGHTRNS